MASVFAALALMSGAIGAGFASGREILRFFAVHGAASGAAVISALLMLALCFLRLPACLVSFGCPSLGALCRARLGQRLGRFCAALFVLLFSVTGGAMLSACAELAALLLPIRHAYAIGMILSLLIAARLSRRGLSGLALAGMLLCAFLPLLMLRLLALPAGEACFLPAMTPDLPVRAVLDGAAYGALNAAMLAGMLPLLLPLSPAGRRRAAAVFSLLFGALLCLGVAVCAKHMPAILHQPLPFVYISRALGKGGYFLVAVCLYIASLSTLLSMLTGLSRMLCSRLSLVPSLLCLFFALFGFGPIVQHAYPVLGALCAGLLLVLCMPGDMRTTPV